jgi:hypothetical protein
VEQCRGAKRFQHRRVTACCLQLAVPSRAVVLRYLVALGAIGAVVLVWIRYGDVKVTILVGILGLLVSAFRFLPSAPRNWLVEPRPSQPEQVDKAAEALARSVRVQWTAERQRRRLEDAHSMSIRWTVEERYSRGSVRAGTPVAGDLASVIDDFVAKPRGLVVIGDPGSGKTGLCVLLTLELLAASLPQGRVPVLLQVSSWDPQEHFSAWIARRLLEDYPWLAGQSAYGATACAELVTQQRLLPILDGLDEMPQARRSAALEALQRDLDGQPFVLTCRTNEFAMAQSDRLLRSALVVRLLPLESTAAAGYLLDGISEAGLDRWQPVLTRITDEPVSPVGIALTKPLNLFLTQTVYQNSAADPAELLDESRFPTPDDIEKRLLDAFFQVAFDMRPPAAGSNSLAPMARWDPARSERTLVFVARVLSDRKTRDLAWWELSTLVPRWAFFALRGPIGMVVTGALCAVLFGLFGQVWFGLFFGMATGLAVALALQFTPAERPRRIAVRNAGGRRFAFRSLIADLEFLVIGGLGGGAVAGLLYGPLYGTFAGLVFGVAFAMVRRFLEPTEPQESVSPNGLLVSDRAAVVYATLTGLVTGVLVGGTLGGFVGGRTMGLVIDLGGPFQEGLLGAAIGGVLGGAVLGMMMQSNSASGLFVTTRLWLAVRRHTPLRLMSFLRDAHQAGILRQVGAYYQFRHASLQDRLATRGTEQRVSSPLPIPTPDPGLVPPR